MKCLSCRVLVPLFVRTRPDLLAVYRKAPRASVPLRKPIAPAQRQHRSSPLAALAAAVGRESLKALPRLVERAAGHAGESLARSQRISSAKLADASDWRATRDPMATWKELA